MAHARALVCMWGEGGGGVGRELRIAHARALVCMWGGGGGGWGVAAVVVVCHNPVLPGIRATTTKLCLYAHSMK